MHPTLNEQRLVKGYRIACGVHGPAEGTPLILLHGTPSHSYIWRNIVPPLADHGFKIYLFDLLGYGASERPADPDVDTSVAAQEGILLALMQQWKIESAHLIAHDIGGAIAQRTAVHFPEKLRSLLLIDTVSYDSWPSESWRAIIAEGLDSLMRAPAREHEQRMRKQLGMTVYDETHMQGERLRAYLAPLTGPIGQASFFQHQVRFYDSSYTEEITSRLQELARLPVLLLWGREDRWQPLSYGHRLARAIPGAELEVLEQAGHFLMEDRPGECSETLLSFLHQQTVLRREGDTGE